MNPVTVEICDYSDFVTEHHLKAVRSRIVSEQNGIIKVEVEVIDVLPATDADREALTRTEQ